MHIVTDSGVDISAEQLAGHKVEVVPMPVQLGGRIYRSGVDLQGDQFYTLLNNTSDYPETNAPSVHDFEARYRRLAQTDPTILSIHISSKLSETVTNARQAIAKVPEANVMLIDSLTVSAGLGWQVEAAVKARAAGWTREEIMPLLKLIATNTHLICAPSTLKYLIHGGRISAWRGRLGQLLHIKPVIGINTDTGETQQLTTLHTGQRMVDGLVNTVRDYCADDTPLRVQVLHGSNASAVAQLTEVMSKAYDCTFLPSTSIAPVLGAHTGPGLIGMAFAPQSIFANLTWERNEDAS